ncbi:hypothetical protein BP00DRAFT_254244 [Aspergillus indologenus CBS 114.80]|uniref:Uncharacterized protein n=1 Tax=Aspergillus indologenus CBS 114.80 TaxID=1450541 RepID=A0A2V5IJU5_9EURO|nr:hypothetical protein BP00DRAFT_254244 [Aspergillus indologenus CBS 114.80]
MQKCKNEVERHSMGERPCVISTYVFVPPCGISAGAKQKSPGLGMTSGSRPAQPSRAEQLLTTDNHLHHHHHHHYHHQRIRLPMSDGSCMK